MEGGPPATTLWWDGIVIAANITDEEAEAAFRVMMEGIDREMVEANNDAAVWLIEGYEPGRLAEGAIATATADPAPAAYPSTSQMGLMHTALGNELPAYFTGDVSAEEALAAVEAAYITSARKRACWSDPDPALTDHIIGARASNMTGARPIPPKTPQPGA